MAGNPLVVHGLRDLDRAFGAASKEARVESRSEWKRVAEPVRVDAEQLTRREIPRIGDRWAQMRTGVTTKVVYVAPKKRGTRNEKLRRPNLAPMLMGRAMEPALERNRQNIEAAAERALDRVGRRFETA